jgi:hypothetical protein
LSIFEISIVIRRKYASARLICSSRVNTDLGQKFRRLIVDEENVDLFIKHGDLALSGVANCGTRTAAVDANNVGT